MGLGTSAAVVIGSFPLGESDRVVTFFSRDFGRIRGVAKSARRLKKLRCNLPKPRQIRHISRAKRTPPSRSSELCNISAIAVFMSIHSY